MNHTMLALPDATRKRYEELALQTGQQPEDVMAEVLHAYLEQMAEDAAHLAEARAEIARGEYVTLEEIQAEDAALLDRLGLTPEQRTAIQAEVEAEATASYDVSCG